MNGTEIVRRLSALKTSRSRVEAIWNDVEKYFMPMRMGDMYQRNTDELSVQLAQDGIYDSIGIWAAQRLAAAMHGTITNPYFKWETILFQNKKLNQIPRCRDWIQQGNNWVFDQLYDGNFDPEISSAYQDLAGPGNTLMSTEAQKEDPKDWQGVNFNCIPLKEGFFERDFAGNVYRFYRWCRWTSTEVKSKWPDLKLPDSVTSALGEGGNPDKRFDVIFCIYERAEKAHNKGTLLPLALNQMPYGSKYVFMDTKDEIGPEGGYYEMPINHCPWEQTSGSLWGHGPAMVVVDTVKYINAWLEQEDMAVRKWNDPPTLATERGLLSDLDLAPGGCTVVQDIDKSIKVFLAEGRIDLSHMKVEDMRKMVKDVFHADELQLKESPAMSATEAQIRYELMNRILGPTMARIQTRLLTPIIMRVWRMGLRNKQLGDIPPEVIDMEAQFKVKYTGPLMRAQNADAVASIERYVGQIGAMAKVFPRIGNIINPVKVGRALADLLDVPGDINNSEAEVQALEEAQQKVAIAQAKAQLMQQQGVANQEHAAGQEAVQGMPQ